MTQVLGDRYQVQQQLSKGDGRGTLLALDLFTQEWVVIKLLLCRDGDNSDDLRLFRREAETLKVLSHPAIPRYLDDFELQFQDGKGVASVQTYLAGRPLQDYLDRKRAFNEADAKQIAIAVLKILVYLHGHKPPILHRDIKPSNILVGSGSGDRLGPVYLIDFDSAQNFVTPATGSFTVIGTYGYSSPELAAGRSVQASDLYGLGVTLVALITGSDPAKLPRRGLRIDFEQVIYLTPAFATWLRQMIDPSLDKRFASADDALRALESILSKQATTIQKPIQSRVSFTRKQHILEILAPALFGTMRLRIDQHISQSYEIFGFKYRRSPLAPRQEIQKLEATKERITIHAGNQIYELGTQHRLTESELTWLAQELGDWLRLPIRHGKS